MFRRSRSSRTTPATRSNSPPRVGPRLPEGIRRPVRELFPRLPKGREKAIAEHACRKYSGRVDRSASAKAFDEAAVRLAVVAHIRHRETNYDELLMRGFPCNQARAAIAEQVDRTLESWKRQTR